MTANDFVEGESVCDHKQSEVRIGYHWNYPTAGGRAVYCGTCGADIFGRTWIMGEIAAGAARKEGFPVADWWFDDE